MSNVIDAIKISLNKLWIIINQFVRF